MDSESRETLNDLDDLISAIALEPAELNELADSSDNDALLCGASDGDPSATLEVEESFVPQYVESPQDGVLVHPEHRCEVLGQWKTISWTRFALGDRSADLGSHLIVNRDRF